MRKQMVAAAMASAMVVASVGLAGAANGDSAYVMPDLKGATLKAAIDAVHAATNDDTSIKINIQSPTVNQKQLNLTNWVVCYQTPKADNQINPKTKRVFLYVKRPNEKDCF